MSNDSIIFYREKAAALARFIDMLKISIQKQNLEVTQKIAFVAAETIDETIILIRNLSAEMQKSSDDDSCYHYAELFYDLYTLLVLCIKELNASFDQGTDDDWSGWEVYRIKMNTFLQEIDSLDGGNE